MALALIAGAPRALGQGSEYGVSAAGTSQSTATALAAITSATAHVVTSVGTGQGVRLPACAAGSGGVSGSGVVEQVYNTTSTQLALYPNSGDQINALGTNNPITVNGPGLMIVQCVNANVWVQSVGLVSGTDPIIVSRCSGGSPVSGACLTFDSTATLPNPISGASGPFTPALTGSTGAPTLTYTTQTGNYLKIGALTCVTGSIVGSESVAGTGDAEITGFPFTAQNTLPQALWGWQINNLTWPSSALNPAIVMQANTTTARIISNRTSSTSTNWQITALPTSGNFTVNFSGCYVATS
jgi:hypothetical protein